MRMQRALLLGAILAIACFASRVHAEDTLLPAPLRTLLLFKVLTYDQAIAKGRDQLRVGIVALKGKKESEQSAMEMATQIKKVLHLKVSGLKLSVEIHLVADAFSLEKVVDKQRPSLLYLTLGVEGMMDKLCKLASQKKILLASGEEKHIQSCAAFAVVRRDRKPKILVNYRVSKAQGADFSDRLLQMAEVSNR